MTNRITDPVSQAGEEELDSTLRPQTLASYIGQEPIRAGLVLAIAAAKQRGDTLDHTLLFGPPGLGKTTLANIIAHEMGVNIYATSGPAIERQGDLAAILTNLKEGDILFIDEIHRLGRSIEEVLYSAMEDFCLDIMVGKGPSARSLKLTLPKFTLIGATTRAGALSSPLRDRFGNLYRLEFYSDSEIKKIIERASQIMKVGLASEAAELIAKSSRATPRTANRILRRVRDFAEVHHSGQISADTVHQTLAMLAIDQSGLDAIDRRILSLVINQFKGGPVGLQSLAAHLNEDPQTLEDVYEPYLIGQGYIHRTAQGRIAGDLAYRHLGVPQPTSSPHS